MDDKINALEKEITDKNKAIDEAKKNNLALSKKVRDALKKTRNMEHCPKRWEGVQTESRIFHIVQMGH